MATTTAATEQTSDAAARAAALAARAYQTGPTTEAFAVMQDAIDRALAVGATRADIRAALTN